jgi:hypothetical protein
MADYAMPVLWSSSVSGRRTAPSGSPEEAAGGDHAGTAIPVRLGVLTREVCPELVDRVVAQAGRCERRARLLPARSVVYFVLALCLFSGADSMGPPGYRSVMRWLTNGLRHLHGSVLPTSPALTKARQRLGAEPLRLLFASKRGALAVAGTAGAFAFGLRLVAWDGTGLDVADTPENEKAFGRVRTGGNPQLRLLALIECGTHAVIDAAFAGVRTVSEQKLARDLLPALRKGMLLLADRNFPGHELWGLAAGTGADLVWRIKKNNVLVPLQALPDGSFLSVMPTPEETRRHGQARAAGRVLPQPPQGHPVRVVEYTVTVRAGDGTTRIEAFRLVTTLLDHHLAPADQLAAIYAQRWEIENGYGELKTRLRGAEFILRSRSPELVTQEVYALLTVYQALCAFEAEAATVAGIDPDRVSFTVAVRVARDHVLSQAAATAATLAMARAEAVADLLADLLPRRRARKCERIKKPPKNTFLTKRHDHIRPPSRVTYEINILRKPA